jgi:predicted DNA binding CopG/RHH family protein
MTPRHLSKIGPMLPHIDEGISEVTSNESSSQSESNDTKVQLKDMLHHNKFETRVKDFKQTAKMGIRVSERDLGFILDQVLDFLAKRK